VNEFFQPPQPSSFIAEVAPHEEWMGPARGELPSVVPVELVMADTREVVVYLDGFSVYGAGFEFEIRVVAENKESKLDPFGFDHRLKMQQTGEISPELLRLGFQFSDGSKVTNTGAWARAESEGFRGRPEAPLMDETRGGWSEGTWSQGYWVWPLPQGDSLDLVCEWPSGDIPLTRTTLEAAPLREAAARARRPFSDDS
jgi:hypothetical protein